MKNDIEKLLEQAPELYATRPRPDDLEMAKLIWLWRRLPKPERDLWREIFASGAPPIIVRWLIRHELGIKLRYNAQLRRFVRWSAQFEQSLQLRNN